MKKLKKALSTLKRLLGLETPPPPAPPPPTPLEITLKELQEKSPEEQKGYIQERIETATKNAGQALKQLEGFQQNAVETGGSVYSQVKNALEQTEIALVLTTKQNQSVPQAEDSPDPLNPILILMERLLEKASVPGKNFVEPLENYLRRFEENLLLIEARGEYKCKISENKRWIKLPLLEFLPNKKTDVKPPSLELSKIFYSFEQVRQFELESRVPMLTTSLLDMEKLIGTKRVTPIRVASPEGWYVLISD